MSSRSPGHAGRSTTAATRAPLVWIVFATVAGHSALVLVHGIAREVTGVAPAGLWDAWLLGWGVGAQLVAAELVHRRHAAAYPLLAVSMLLSLASSPLPTAATDTDHRLWPQLLELTAWGLPLLEAVGFGVAILGIGRRWHVRGSGRGEPSSRSRS